MFRAILRTQWKWTKLAVLVSVLVAFAMPLISLNTNADTRYPRVLISSMQTWGVAYATFAGAVGLLVAWLAWASDHRGHHVYALTLPVARWRYVLLRFGAGVVFLIPIVVALGIGSVLATSTNVVPEGLHAYPMALTLRFAFAALVAFAIFFAISAASARSAAVILGAICAVLVVEFLTDAMGLGWHVGLHAVDFLMVYPGILSVFSGRWTLIDV
jgi:FtsH-binding integral membrane protein